MHAAFALCAFLATVVLSVSPTLAADIAPVPLTSEDRALVEKGADYIQSLKAVQGTFTQIDPKGQVSTGTFYMQRPGRARFQYNRPSELLVVADGDTVSIYDRKLKSFDQLPLEQTPLTLLLAKTIKWDRGVAITGVERHADSFAIEARDARKQAPGRLSILFSQNPLALKGWTVLDAQDQKTEVRLGALTQKSSLDPNLFVLKDPRAPSERP